MNRSPNTRATDRLIDYFAVIGPGDQLVVLEDGPVSYATPSGKPHPFKTEFGATVLDRYPLEDHADTPFPTGVSNFCFPMGIRLRRPAPPDEPLPTFFSFIATGSKAESVFGHVLTFSERMTPAQLACIDTDVGAAASGGGDFFAPKAFCLLSRWDFGVEFRTILTELYRSSVSPAPLPLERLISNITVEIPLPPAGRVEVLFQIGSATVTFRRPPKNRLVSPLDLPFREDLENVLTLVKSVLLEKQILLMSSQLSLLTATTEVLVSLIYPFRWCHTAIPVLPRGLLEVLQSPMPFILGMHLEQWHEAVDEIPPWVVQVDLDRNLIMTGEAMVLPQIGDKLRRKLMRALQANGDVFAHRGADWATARLPNYDSAFNFAARPSEADDDPLAALSSSSVADEAHDPGSDEDERGKAGVLGGYTGAGSGRSGVSVNWHAVRRAFFRVFVSLFMRYREFVIYPSNTTAASSTPGDQQGALFQRRFNKEGFLASTPSDARELVALVLSTQAFANFIDDRIQPDAETDVDVAFFDESIDAKFNRSRFTFSKRETPLLDSHEYRVSKTVVALQPDTSALPPDRLYRYTPLPRLDRTLFGRRREVPVIADAPTAIGTDYQRLRRLPWAAAATVAKTGAQAADSGSLAPVRLSAAENVYMAWFILFSASLDVVGAEVGRVAGEVFDILERAAAIDAMRAQQAEAQRLLSIQEAREIAELAEFASPQVNRGTSLLGDASPAASFGALDDPTRGATRGSMALAALLPNASVELRSPEFRSPARSVSAVADSVVSGAAAPARGAVFSGSRASTRTPALLRRETAVTTARGVYFSQQLEIAFAVHERMLFESVQADEAVYRALLDICGRCGNFGKAYAVMDELTRRGIAQDASLYRTLFHAFYATDPDAKSAAASQSLQLGALGFGGNRAPVASQTPGTARKPSASGSSGISSTPTPTPSRPPAPPGPTPPVHLAIVSAASAPKAPPATPFVAGPPLSAAPASAAPTPTSLFKTLFRWHREDPPAPRAGSIAASLASSDPPKLRTAVPASASALPTPPPPPPAADEAAAAPSASSDALADAVNDALSFIGLPRLTSLHGSDAHASGVAIPSAQASSDVFQTPAAPPVCPAAADAAPTYVIPPSSAVLSATGVTDKSPAPDSGISAPFSDAASVSAPGTSLSPDLPRRRLDSFLSTEHCSASAGADTLGSSVSAPVAGAALEPPPAPPMYPPYVVVSATIVDRRQPDFAPLPADLVIRSDVSSGRGGWRVVGSTSSEARGGGSGFGAPPSGQPHRTQQMHVGAVALAATPSVLPPSVGAADASAAIASTPSFGRSGRPPLSSDVGSSSAITRGLSTRGTVAKTLAGAAGTPRVGPMQPPNSEHAGASASEPGEQGPLVRACVEGSAALTTLFPGLAIDTLRETCPACDRPLSDADIRAGWAAGSAQDYTTVCPVCPPVIPGAGSGAVPRPSASRGGVATVDAFGARGAGASTARRQRFVARFSVTADSAAWRGSAGSGPGALLYCEYLPPAVMVKELQTAIAHGHVGPSLRQSCPSLFWNLCLWLLSFALPTGPLAHLARADDDAGDSALGIPAFGRGRSITLSVGQEILPPAATSLGGNPALSGGDALRAEAEALLLRLPSDAARSSVRTATTALAVPVTAPPLETTSAGNGTQRSTQVPVPVMPPAPLNDSGTAGTLALPVAPPLARPGWYY